MRMAYITEETAVNIDQINTVVDIEHLGWKNKTRIFLSGTSEYVQVEKTFPEVMAIIEERANRTQEITRQGVTYNAAV